MENIKKDTTALKVLRKFGTYFGLLFSFRNESCLIVYDCSISVITKSECAASKKPKYWVFNISYCFHYCIPEVRCSWSVPYRYSGSPSSKTKFSAFCYCKGRLKIYSFFEKKPTSQQILLVDKLTLSPCLELPISEDFMVFTVKISYFWVSSAMTQVLFLKFAKSVFTNPCISQHPKLCS